MVAVEAVSDGVEQLWHVLKFSSERSHCKLFVLFGDLVHLPRLEEDLTGLAFILQAVVALPGLLVAGVCLTPCLGRVDLRIGL